MLIYKITCLDNNKIYIGQTTEPMDKRFRRHLNLGRLYAEGRASEAEARRSIVRAIGTHG